MPESLFKQILQNSQENIFAGVSFLNKVRPQACNFIKTETLAPVLTCKIGEITKNTFFYRTPLVAASEQM